MNIKEELYILTGGKRLRLDIASPSGITLNYKSNLFNDLSKFCASYTYTFKLAKTLNNVAVFDLIEDVRHSSKFYGKKIECEYYRDGLRLFNNSWLYISEAGDTYSAVMTWDVLTWLKEINDDGKSIKDLESSLAGEQLTTVQFGCGTYTCGAEQTMDSPTFGAIYRCGTSAEVSKIPPCVPVRYLLDRIARQYGETSATDIFSFLGADAVATSDLIEAAAVPFPIFEDGVIPMVSGKWSNAYKATQFRNAAVVKAESFKVSAKTMPMIDTQHYTWDSGYASTDAILYVDNEAGFVKFGEVSGVSDFVQFHRYTGTATTTAETMESTTSAWTKTSKETGLYIGFSQANIDLPIKVRGVIRTNKKATLRFLKFSYLSGQTVGDCQRYIPKTDSDGNLEDTIDVESVAVDGADGLYEINFDPAKGGEEVDIESKDNDRFAFVVMQLESALSGAYITDGYLHFLPSRDNVSFSISTPNAIDKVDLFCNLPDIKVIDLLKSLFYIEDAYPKVDADGKIGMMRYKDIYSNIASGNVYDWSALLTGDGSDDTIEYTTGAIGRTNRLAMKNYSSTDSNDDESPLTYEDASATFECVNETIDSESTIYTFPYASAAKVTSAGNDAGNTFIFWAKDDTATYKPQQISNPIIGRVRTLNRGTCYGWKAYDVSVGQYLKFDIWQVADVDVPNTVRAQILKKPYVVKTSVLLDSFDLQSLDFTKPVYLQRYNAYFAIITLKVNSSGVTSAELVKLPEASSLTKTEASAPVVTISGNSPMYKAAEGTDAYGRINVSAKCKNSTITNLTISLDGTEIMNEAMEEVSWNVSFESGTHTIAVTATAKNGLSTTETKEVEVRYASDGVVIEFFDCPASLTISAAKTNTTSLRAAVYNVASIKYFGIYKSISGASTRTTFAESTTDAAGGTWSFFEQLASGDVEPRVWKFTASVLDADGVTTSRDKLVTVSVDKDSFHSVAEDSFTDDGVATIFGTAGAVSITSGDTIEGYLDAGDCKLNLWIYFIKPNDYTSRGITPYFVQYLFTCTDEDTGDTKSIVYNVDPHNVTNATYTMTEAVFGNYTSVTLKAKAYYLVVGNWSVTGQPVIKETETIKFVK